MFINFVFLLSSSSGSPPLGSARLSRDLPRELDQSVCDVALALLAPLHRPDRRRHLSNLHPRHPRAAGSHLVPLTPGILGLRHRGIWKPGKITM
jgi:hypothetical protein